MGSMFFGDPVAAFANLHRALRPDGRLTLLTWQGVTDNEWLTEFRAALAVGRDLPTPPPDAPSPFALADPDRVRAILERRRLRRRLLPESSRTDELRTRPRRRVRLRQRTHRLDARRPRRSRAETPPSRPSAPRSPRTPATTASPTNPRPGSSKRTNPDRPLTSASSASRVTRATGAFRVGSLDRSDAGRRECALIAEVRGDWLRGRDAIGGKCAARGLGVEMEEVGCVESENLRFDGVGEFRVTESVLKLIRDREGAEGLQLGLWRSVPDGVRTPEHTVFADALQQFPEGVGGGRRVPQHLTPDCADVDPDVAVRRDAVHVERAEEQCRCRFLRSDRTDLRRDSCPRHRGTRRTACRGTGGTPPPCRPAGCVPRRSARAAGPCVR